MSRFIRKPVALPDGVTVAINGDWVHMKGPYGEVKRRFQDTRLAIVPEEKGLTVQVKPDADREATAMAGTYWSILNGMAVGAKDGVERILDLVGVGYRAQISGQKIVLQLGFSHPVNYTLPDGVTATMANQTEIVLKSADKELVGQAAADIRSYRPPEPYKGKGVRYRGELVMLKETKKK